MKKKIVIGLIGISAIALTTGAVIFFTGGGIEQTKTTATLEAGEKFEFKPNEYFEGLPEDVKTKDFKIDDSKLDNTKPGKYDVKITYDKEEYKIKVKVEDTIAPEVSEVETIRTNDLTNIEKNETIKVEDATETTVTIDRYEKVSDNTTDWQNIVSQNVTDDKSNDDNFKDREAFTPEANADGIYTAVLKAEDLGKNKTEKEIAIVYDTTAPQLYLEGNPVTEMNSYQVEQEDVTAQPEYNLASYQFIDAVDGDLTQAVETTIEQTDAENHVWTVKAKTKDTIGNEAEYSYTITVVQKQAEPEEKETTGKKKGSTSGGNSSTGGSSLGGNAGGGNTSNGTTSEPAQQTGWSYEARRAQYDYMVQVTDNEWRWYFFARSDERGKEFSESYSKFQSKLREMNAKHYYHSGYYGAENETTQEDLDNGYEVFYFKICDIL